MPATHVDHASARPHEEHRQTASRHHYGRLLLMTVLSFAAMYVLMYAMVNALDAVYNSANQAYMAGLMAAAMVVIELAVTRGMYHNRRLNTAILVLSVIALAGCWALIRTQGAIGDRGFLRSMIPHHSGAILMCREASITDPQIADLCKRIVASQQEEIDEMKGVLNRLER